ncbi:hypothetical protein C6501_14915 [Candidatus Poribacteria bacterium]|nr:MAG: hypothetical protein C6501_14915 [Candidatus Poribacteria bacterium]
MRLILVFIGIVSIVCVYGGVRLFWKPAAHSSNIAASQSIVSDDAVSVSRTAKRPVLPKHTDTQQVDSEAFYQTIIDNNIFRPLNWDPPLRQSAYALLGTAIAADGSTATAYIQERKSDRFYAVSVGQQVGKMTVQTITAKQVTLTQNGESLTLAISSVPFLNPRGTPIRDSTMSYITKAVPPKNETSKRSTKSTQQPNAASEWRKHLEEKAAKIRAERKRLTEYLQQHQRR